MKQAKIDSIISRIRAVVGDHISALTLRYIIEDEERKSERSDLTTILADRWDAKSSLVCTNSVDNNGNYVVCEITGGRGGRLSHDQQNNLAEHIADLHNESLR